MDKELKELQEVMCCGCPYDELTFLHCDKNEAFKKVKHMLVDRDKEENLAVKEAYEEL